LTDPCSVVLAGEQTSIFGKWEKEEDNLIFIPVIPLTQGLTYQLKSQGQILQTFSVHTPEGKATRLLAIYPSVDTVPANLLKVHLSFSGPMGEQYSTRFVTVTDIHGDTMEKIFLPLRPELWNDAQDQLTLWLDPGRIKRGLGPNQELGQPLEKEQIYHVNISADWRDHHGKPLERTYQKTVFVSAADRDIPDLMAWNVQSPESETMDPLNIDFKEPLDYSLVADCIFITRDEEPVAGNIRLKQGDRMAVFTPDQNWQPGTYQIVVESRLEDLAGNNLNRRFDEDIGGNTRVVVNEEFYVLDFEIR